MTLWFDSDTLFYFKNIICYYLNVCGNVGKLDGRKGLVFVKDHVGLIRLCLVVVAVLFCIFFSALIKKMKKNSYVIYVSVYYLWRLYLYSFLQQLPLLSSLFNYFQEQKAYWMPVIIQKLMKFFYICVHFKEKIIFDPIFFIHPISFLHEIKNRKVLYKLHFVCPKAHCKRIPLLLCISKLIMRMLLPPLVTKTSSWLVTWRRWRTMPLSATLVILTMSLILLDLETFHGMKRIIINSEMTGGSISTLAEVLSS